MPRIVPSAVVNFIDKVFSASVLGRGNAGQLSALINLVEDVPFELLAMEGMIYAEFLCGVGEIRETLKRWAADRSSRDTLDPVPGFNGATATQLIRQAMLKCPDEAPAPSVDSLSFVRDTDLREGLRTDIGTVHRALAGGEWKAATVIAGSAVEALLLSALQWHRPTSDVLAAAADLLKSGTFTAPVPPDLEKWSLFQYIEVASKLALIRSETTIQCRLTKDFRNLIHPGKALRLGTKPTMGTALSAVAGLQQVVDNLTP